MKYGWMMPYALHNADSLLIWNVYEHMYRMQSGGGIPPICW